MEIEEWGGVITLIAVVVIVAAVVAQFAELIGETLINLLRM
jgi:hypothetical protein